MILNEAEKGKMVVSEAAEVLGFLRGRVITVLLFFSLHIGVWAFGQKVVFFAILSEI